MALVEHPHSKDQRKAPEGQGCPAAPSCVAVGSHHCARHSEWGLARGERPGQSAPRIPVRRWCLCQQQLSESEIIDW
jgi:hypothetical protein